MAPAYHDHVDIAHIHGIGMFPPSTLHRFGGARIEQGTLKVPGVDLEIGGAMRIPLLIGSIVLLGACAGAQSHPWNDEPVSGHWQGVLLRNGQRAPIAVDLSAEDRDWRGRFSAGVDSGPLQDVRVTATSVHFELPGEGTFDGAVVGDSIAGSISGAGNGSFTLKRRDASEPHWTPYLVGP
jgi:hypothetical protein